MSDYLKKRYADTSFILTIILQMFCYRYIHYSESLLIFSTLMYFTCFLMIVESIDLILKKQKIVSNLGFLLFGISAIVFFITNCLLSFCELKNEFFVLLIFAVSFIILMLSYWGKSDFYNY